VTCFQQNQLVGHAFATVWDTSLFTEGCTSGAISAVYTEFYVDHEEPLSALEVFKEEGKWFLGELLEGHEFLIILPI
jgi:hypothetical protein